MLGAACNDIRTGFFLSRHRIILVGMLCAVQIMFDGKAEPVKKPKIRLQVRSSLSNYIYKKCEVKSLIQS